MAQAKIILADLFSIADALESSPFISNTVVRKYKTKLISRAALRMVPGKTISSDEDADVPEEIETILEQLFAALQDKVSTFIHLVDIYLHVSYRIQLFDGLQQRASLVLQTHSREILRTRSCLPSWDYSLYIRSLLLLSTTYQPLLRALGTEPVLPVQKWPAVDW